ncbi:hypothetical protein [Nostoc sp. DedQUE04]|uniref:hypothetical protein n=1 Tax=Nostoc sp. DedQUE04 TaxID=3075390 RepID=UPI002AD35C3A|nr:hypothetical protein [Nostoc sp. DedQUE04]
MARNDGTRTKQQTSGTAARVPTKPQLDYSVRYGNNYSRECAIARSELEKYGSLCCCCLKRKFDELHHTSYGSNHLGKNWFPTCERCHTEICHNSGNWIVDNKNPVWGNRNTEKFTLRLRLGYQLLYSTNS